MTVSPLKMQLEKETVRFIVKRVLRRCEVGTIVCLAPRRLPQASISTTTTLRVYSTLLHFLKHIKGLRTELTIVWHHSTSTLQTSMYRLPRLRGVHIWTNPIHAISYWDLSLRTRVKTHSFWLYA